MGMPLQGLTGLYDDIPRGPGGRDPSEWGTPQDPRHGNDQGPRTGETMQQVYPSVIDRGDIPAAPGEDAGPGEDYVPLSHTAPAVPGIVHDSVEYAQWSQDLHGVDHGASSRRRAPVPAQLDLDQNWNVSSGESILAKPPAQLAQGRDVDQGSGVPNSGTFGKWHHFRRWFTTPVPRTYGDVGERPFYGHHPVGTPSQDGPDSPYGVQGDTSGGQPQAAPTTNPSPYVQPPNPPMAAVSDYGNDGSWGWED
jgi:hypothetical protein